MTTGTRVQMRNCLLLIAGLAFVVAPLWRALSRSTDVSRSVSVDAAELGRVFGGGTQANGGGLADEALARTQLEAFASRTEMRANGLGLSGLGLASVALGGALLALGAYGSVNYGRRVDADVEWLRGVVSSDASPSAEGKGGATLKEFRALAEEFERRISLFDDWIERLNNDRTDALAELERERFSLLERLSEKSKAARAPVGIDAKKGDFLATMSHEVRTPMNGVLAVADDLLSYDLEREIKQKVEMIKVSGESLVRILDDVLDFSKIEAGKLEVKRESFDLLFACNATFSLFTAQAKEKGLRYDCFIGSDVPRFARGDSVRVRQVLANLLSNALKFTEEGGVSLSVSRQSRDQDGLLISVTDTGIGIDVASSDRLFEAFGQAKSGLEEKGTGLGLAISKRLASLMEGDLTYRENVPTGTVFEFWMPFWEGTSVEEEVDLSKVADAVENARILVVEDNRINQHVIESLLERAEHTVHLAANGLDALDLVDQFAFDLIFMDCLMPKLDGFETSRRIRALPPQHVNRGTPIIALTANAFASDRDRCYEAGMNDFLAKPVKKDVLLGAVNHYCRARKG